MGAAFMAFSALLIHQSGGVIEVHFHIFAGMAFMLVYRDWRVPIVSAVVVAIHHLALDTFQDTHHQLIHLLPAGRHGLSIVALHAVFVVFEAVVLVMLSITLEREVVDMADHRARVAAEREELAELADRLERRDLSISGEAGTEASAAMRGGIAQVADLVRAIRATAHEVAESSREVVAGAEDAGRVSAEIVSAVSDVAAGAERQAVLVSETHDAAVRVTDAVRGNAEEAAAAAEAAEAARTLAGEGRTAVEDAGRAMAGAREGSQAMTSARWAS